MIEIITKKADGTVSIEIINAKAFTGRRRDAFDDIVDTYDRHVTPKLRTVKARKATTPHGILRDSELAVLAEMARLRPHRYWMTKRELRAEAIKNIIDKLATLYVDAKTERVEYVPVHDPPVPGDREEWLEARTLSRKFKRDGNEAHWRRFQQHAKASRRGSRKRFDRFERISF